MYKWWWNQANNFCTVLLGKATKNLAQGPLGCPGTQGLWASFHTFSACSFQSWVLGISFSLLKYGPAQASAPAARNHLCFWIKVRYSSWAMKSPKKGHRARYKTSRRSVIYMWSLQSLPHEVRASTCSINTTWVISHDSDKKCVQLLGFLKSK